jgi:hypothetical protein
LLFVIIFQAVDLTCERRARRLTHHQRLLVGFNSRKSGRWKMSFTSLLWCSFGLRCERLRHLGLVGSSRASFTRRSDPSDPSGGHAPTENMERLLPRGNVDSMVTSKGNNNSAQSISQFYCCSARLVFLIKSPSNRSSIDITGNKFGDHFRLFRRFSLGGDLLLNARLSGN